MQECFISIVCCLYLPIKTINFIAMKQFFFSFILFSLFSNGIYSQNTIGLLQHDSATLDDGYVFFSPMGSNSSYLIDKCGREVHNWPSTYKPGVASYILPDGTLLRTGATADLIFIAGGKGGIIEKINWNGQVTWSYVVSDSFKCQHHDVKALPNGNVLVVAWEAKNKVDAISQGRNPILVAKRLWSEQILEIEPIGKDSGKVVWEWHLWDHLVQDFDSSKSNYGVVNAKPELLDLNFKASPTIADWIHINSIDYNAKLDQILLSAHSLSEIWVIDHSTSTSQAATHAGGNAGKGGDILYRWGNPLAYKTGTTSQFFGQHNAHWIDSGLPYQNQIMVFNNGNGRTGGNYTTIEILNPPLSGYNYNATLPYLPDTSSWTYNAGNTHNFYANLTSSAQQLSNGNVIFANGPAGVFSEVDSTGKKLWEYVNPTEANGINTQGKQPAKNSCFRCTFYPSDYSGFKNHTLMAGKILEDTNIMSSNCNLNLPNGISERVTAGTFDIYPNPANDFIRIQANGLSQGNLNIEIYDIYSKLMIKSTVTSQDGTAHVDLNNLSSGCYIINIASNNFVTTKKILITK